jgi:hypothetical protein
MPLLANPRHERFCQALLEGKPASTAYEEAGYVPNDGNAIRLKGNERVQARLRELQAEAAKNSEVTVQSLLAELEDARQRANSLDQLSAVVKAISEKAKISGLLVQKVEIGGAGAFDECRTFEDIADEMLTGPGSPIALFRPVDEKDRRGLIDLVQRLAAELGEYLDAIKARPIVAERVDLAKLPSRWQELRPYSAVPAPRRLTNGR